MLTDRALLRTKKSTYLNNIEQQLPELSAIFFCDYDKVMKVFNPETRTIKNVIQY